MKAIARSIGADRLPDRDLTGGNLHKHIWYLALPMVLEMSVLNVSQILAALWIGKLGSAALAAVTISAAIRWVISGLANGLGIGGMAVVARRIGARDRTAAGQVVWQTILLGIGVSLLLSGLGLLLARPALVLLGADAQVLPLGLSYLQITLGGLLALVLQFAINSMLRGAGDVRLAMSVLFLHTAVTVMSQRVLIFGWGPFPALGVAGAAWGNVLGLCAGVALQAMILLSSRARIGINLRDMKPDLPLMGRIIRIALPSMVQMMLRSASRLIIVGLVGLYGTFAMAGYGVANRLLQVAVVPIFGLGNAAGTLVGQNLGACKPERAERNAWWISAYAAGYMTIVAVLLFAFARPLIGLFDPTPQVVDIGAECLRAVTPALILVGLGVVLAGGFEGAGDTVPAMVVNLLTLWGVEAALAYGLAQWLGLGVTGIWWGRAIANVANGLLLAFWFRLGRWKQREV
jgi:putative MATE family efflux protein